VPDRGSNESGENSCGEKKLRAHAARLSRRGPTQNLKYSARPPPHTAQPSC
jgi:hypothetical protein